jgi:hypothetical protein
VQPKLNDFSSTVVISAVEESLREFWGNWGRAPQSELYDSPDMLRLSTGVPYSFCNGVSCRQLSPDTIDSVIDQTISYYQARNAIWEWVVGPNTMPAFLDETLEKHGLCVHGESYGMAIDLHATTQDIPLTNILFGI